MMKQNTFQNKMFFSDDLVRKKRPKIESVEPQLWKKPNLNMFRGPGCLTTPKKNPKYGVKN